MIDDDQLLYPVDVDLSSRAIRIVFFVPAEEDETSHLILDAVFRAGYDAWNGGYYLIVPVARDGAPDGSYRAWMKAIDPDLIYSYVDLSESVVEELHRELCPMGIFRHQLRGHSSPLRAYDFMPAYEWLQKPLSSATCLFEVPRSVGFAVPTVLGAYDDSLVSRFIGDNFGVTRFQRDLPGVLAVKILCQPDLPESHATSVDRIFGDLTIVANLRERKLTASSELARVTRSNQAVIRNLAHSGSLFLTIGDSIADRVDSWNRRLLCSDHLGASASLRMSLSELNDSALAYEVAQFILRLDGGDRYHLHLCSRSHEEAVVRTALQGMTGRLANIFRQKARWSSIPAVPREQDCLEWVNLRLFDEGETTILHKPNQALRLPRPPHVSRLPPSFASLNHGSWMTSARIGRPEAERIYSNEEPRWIFPRRFPIARLLTTSPARIDRHGRIAIFASSGDSSQWSEQEPLRTATLVSPRVEDVFQYAIASEGRDLNSDHYTISLGVYRGLKVSDKGQHLKGVVKLFNGLEQAGAFVSNSHWRSLLTNARDEKGRQVRWAIEEMQEVTNRQAVLDALVSSHRGDRQEANALLRARLRDALESFVQLRVLYRGYKWSCQYCGNVAVVGVGKLSEVMTCDVCENRHSLPLDLKFSYSWNDFLYQAIIGAHGLPVVWALNRARESFHSCFAWMPEVLIDWQDGSPGNEIDYLVIIDGRITACEVKSAVAVFLTDDPNGTKFSSIISRLRADRGVLAFERIGRPTEDLAQLRQSLAQVVADMRRSTGIPIDIIVAEETDSFQGPPTEFGTFGNREQGLWR